MRVRSISTKVYRLGEDFKSFLIENIKDCLKEKEILAITSKIVSLSENRIVSKKDTDKKELIYKEADTYLGEIGYGCHLTIKQGLLVPSAGVDESNAEKDNYILYPLNPFLSVKKIYHFIKQELGLKEFGILLTDSYTLPLRRGVIGLALAYYGFRGVENKIGEEDLFGRKLKMTQVNLADALAAAAVYTMGEGGERRPLAIVKAPVKFVILSDNSELRMPLKEDLYSPLLQKSLKIR